MHRAYLMHLFSGGGSSLSFLQGCHWHPPLYVYDQGRKTEAVWTEQQQQIVSLQSVTLEGDRIPASPIFKAPPCDCSYVRVLELLLELQEVAVFINRL